MDILLHFMPKDTLKQALTLHFFSNTEQAKICMQSHKRAIKIKLSNLHVQQDALTSVNDLYKTQSMLVAEVLLWKSPYRHCLT